MSIKKFENFEDEFDGEGVDKSEITMKVADTSTSQEEWQQYMAQDGVTLLVSAWYTNAQYMVDSELSFIYPELEEIEGLYDLQEGCMEYSGPLTAQQMVDELIRLGFNAVIE